MSLAVVAALASCSVGQSARVTRPLAQASGEVVTSPTTATHPPTRDSRGAHPPVRATQAKRTPPNDHQLPSGAARNQIAIPALDVTAPIDIPCVDQNGEIFPLSTDPRRTCIWDGGAQVGAAKGTEMILGHINYSGVAGALGRIGTLHAGDRVYLWDAARNRSTWLVTVIHERPKADGVDPGAEVGAAGPPRLVLVTCGGPWIGGHFGYADLIWVYARPN